MTCQDRDCKREAEGSPVLIHLGRAVEVELQVCKIHRRLLDSEVPDLRWRADIGGARGAGWRIYA